jgi:lipase ATG15
MRHSQSEDIPWQEDEVPGPDVESRETLLELAKMTHNAYMDPNDPAWYELDGNWTVVSMGTFVLFQYERSVRACR